MKRDRTQFLLDWLDSPSRRPLIIRGARQVGKTWLIRDLARSQQRPLIELNFEKRPDLASLFSSNDPKEVLLLLASALGSKIDISKAILFLDEIQAVPQLLEKLRWFAEDMPQLAVIATGSLLDFTLSEHSFSMPVGRIGYIYLEPLSFEEFLDATGQQELRSYLEGYECSQSIPEAIHNQCMRAIKEYMIVGGMPAAVASWSSERSPEAVNRIHFDLLSTYRDDFAKYRGRIALDRLNDVMNSIPRQLGRKFVYKEVNQEVTASPLKQALELLAQARVCHRVVATSGNGLPLGAEADDRCAKVILLDCGLCGASLGLSLHQLSELSEISVVNSGGMAEQLVGQLLRTLTPAYIPPALYYWQREKKSAEAEIDYLIAYENQCIPIEVKAGTTGSLKSLHQFVKEKKKSIAIRVNSDVPRYSRVEVKDSVGSSIEYDLLSLPFYLLGQLHRLLRSSSKLA